MKTEPIPCEIVGVVNDEHGSWARVSFDDVVKDLYLPISTKDFLTMKMGKATMTIETP